MKHFGKRFKNLEEINSVLVACGWEEIDYIESGSEEENELIVGLWEVGIDLGDDVNEFLIDWEGNKGNK